MDGGGNWGGAAFDPTTNRLYVRTSEGVSANQVCETDPNLPEVDVAYTNNCPRGGSAGIFRGLGGYVPAERSRLGPIPLIKPPYARLVSIDLNAGDIAWSVPFGEGSRVMRSHPLLRDVELPDRLGTPGAPGSLVTGGGLVFLGGGDPYLSAFDAETGREVSRVPTEFRTSGNPMTYRSRAGRQFVLIATGAGPDARLVAFALPQCRFSTDDIARFFDGKLSRRELATVVERTAGWPVALLVYRNMRAHEATELGTDAARLTENYVGVRLLRDLSTTDRACLLDLAVFDWLDDDLVDEVLGSSDARVRIAAVSSLDGLLAPIDRTRTVRRMHPLLRDYCVGLLSVEDPARKRSLHGRVARALARRDDLLSAWRHASASGDSQLVGELIECFGPYALWLREGVIRLIAADRFLTPELLAGYPRLALLHCTILRLLLKFEEANALYEAVRQRTDGFTRDREGGDADALTVDRIFTQGILASGTDRLAPDEIDALLAVGGGAADGETPAPFVVRARHHLLCLVCYERANFEACRRYGLQSQAHFAENVRLGTIFVDMCLGMAAMAQGRVQEATDLYTRARQGTRKFFSGDPCLAVGTDVLTIELDLERNHEKRIQPRTLKNLAELRGVWGDVHATAIAVSAELTFEQYGHEAVIQLLTTAVDDLRSMNTARLSDNVSALLAYYLVEVGRVDEAEEVWRDHGLPCGVPDLLDLDRQSWRTMESLACARVRLLVEQGECAAAGEIASRLCDTASAHGLTRTLLRGLALSMVVAERAGQTERALARLVEFLRRTREVDYVRPLVRHREVSRVVLRRLLGTDLDTDVRRAAEAMLVHVGKPATATALIFSPRERDVLAVLVEVGEDLGNKAIASRLGITEEGLRYHLRNIYRKTGSSKRADAVRYAQSLGLS